MPRMRIGEPRRYWRDVFCCGLTGARRPRGRA